MSSDGKQKLSRSMASNFLGIFGSRVFGILRDIVFCAYWGGSGVAQAAFQVAFSIPNTFRGLFGEGAFTAAFVPAITEKLERGDKDGAWRLAERTISLQAALLLILLMVCSVLSLGISRFLSPDTREHIVTTFKILPLLLPYALFICLTGAFGSILNSMRKFALPSANPIIFNLVQIAAVAILAKIGWKNDNPASLYAFCIAIILSGLLQLLLLMFICHRNGFTFHFRLFPKDPEVLQIARRFASGALGSGVGLINQWIDKILVAYLGTQAVSSLSFSQHLVYVPVGFFGVAMGVVCLQAMSAAAAKRDGKLLSQQIDYSIRQVLLLSLPCTILLGVLAHPVVFLLFQRGAFTINDATACVNVFYYYLAGVPAFCLMKVATNPHFANKDTKTPMITGICFVGLNLILNLILMRPLKQSGLALSTTICSWCNFCTVICLARKYAPDWKPSTTFIHGMRLLAASLIGGTATWFALPYLPSISSIPTAEYLFQIVSGGIIGLTGFLIAAIAMRAPEPGELITALAPGLIAKIQRH